MTLWQDFIARNMEYPSWSVVYIYDDKTCDKFWYFHTAFKEKKRLVQNKDITLLFAHTKNVSFRFQATILFCTNCLGDHLAKVCRKEKRCLQFLKTVWIIKTVLFTTGEVPSTFRLPIVEYSGCISLTLTPKTMSMMVTWVSSLLCMTVRQPWTLIFPITTRMSDI